LITVLIYYPPFYKGMAPSMTNYGRTETELASGRECMEA
jgi:hypothetical protein